jgi:hypothetical protein
MAWPRRWEVTSSRRRRDSGEGLTGGSRRFKLLATPAGLEPATYCLEGSCSIQLSYGAGNRNLAAAPKAARS